MLSKKFINSLLKNKGMTLEYLIEQLGVTRSTYYSYFKNPTSDKIIAISKVLNCNIHEIIELPEGYEHIYLNKIWIGIKKS